MLGQKRIGTRRPTSFIGIASFTEEEFEILKRTAADADSLDDTYSDWKSNVQRVYQHIGQYGGLPIAVPLTVAEIDAFCAETDQQNNGATRAELVSIKLSKFGMP